MTADSDHAKLIIEQCDRRDAWRRVRAAQLPATVNQNQRGGLAGTVVAWLFFFVLIALAVAAEAVGR